MSLRPWLSRRIPAMSKSTAKMLQGDSSSSMVVDELPPLELDKLLQGLPQEPALFNGDLHPDFLPPLQKFEEASALPQAEQKPDDYIEPTVTLSCFTTDDPHALEQEKQATTANAPELMPEVLCFALDLPPPLPEVDFPPLGEMNFELPPAPLMPPTVGSPATHGIDNQEHFKRPQSAPKLLSLEERKAYMRAVTLFQKLRQVGNEGRQGAINRLFNITVAFPHGASVTAISNLLDFGCDLHEVEDAAALKEHWRSDSALWLRRYLGSLEIYSESKHQAHLSWMAAHILCSALGRERAIDAVQGILLNEWLTMNHNGNSGNAFERCFYYHFILKRAQEIQEGRNDPFLQIYQGTIEDDPIMPTSIEVRNLAPNFTGQSHESIYLPSVEINRSISSNFGR